MAETIKFLLSNYALTFFLLAMIVAIVSILAHLRTMTKEGFFNRLLAYYCLISVGFFFFYNFVMHVFFGKMAAEYIGWADSPFQAEVGFASLGFALVGMLAFRRDFGLRLASIVGPACFLWGAAGGHIYQMIKNNNFAPGNAGIIFWADIFLPIIGFILLACWRVTSGKKSFT